MYAHWPVVIDACSHACSHYAKQNWLAHSTSGSNALPPPSHTHPHTPTELPQSSFGCDQSCSNPTVVCPGPAMESSILPTGNKAFNRKVVLATSNLLSMLINMLITHFCSLIHFNAKNSELHTAKTDWCMSLEMNNKALVFSKNECPIIDF